MQEGQTWTRLDGVARGLLASPRGLILTTSGNAYSGNLRDWDHATPLVRHCLEFMDCVDVRTIRAERLNADPVGAEDRLKRAEAEARRVAREWFAATPASS